MQIEREHLESAIRGLLRMTGQDPAIDLSVFSWKNLVAFYSILIDDCHLNCEPLTTEEYFDLFERKATIQKRLPA
jgi:hypothetical protein